MADLSVTVSFNTTDHTFSFSPDSLDVTEASTITLNRESGATWTFTAFSITPNPGPPGGKEFTSSVASDGSSITVTDADTDTNKPSTHNYTVTVSYGGSTYTSDPQIVNRS